jgi:hypothetical protein
VYPVSLLKAYVQKTVIYSSVQARNPVCDCQVVTHRIVVFGKEQVWRLSEPESEDKVA